MIRFILITVIACLLAFNIKAKAIDYAQSEIKDNKNTYLSNLSKEQKFLYTNLVFAGGVTTYGFINWEYGKRGYNFGNENWFGGGTKEGGADKFGHLYTAYSTSRLVKTLYQKWGFSNNEAAKRAAITSFIFTTTIELGDGFSDFGTSYEDFINNSFGQAIAYYLDTHPKMSEKIDLRFEYNPRDGLSSDPTTDYNSLKYLVAIKMAGFEPLNKGFSRYLEFHLGYYARGYTRTQRYQKEERNVYIGVGINIAQILHDLSFKKTSRIFNYYQAPYSYVSTEHDFNN